MSAGEAVAIACALVCTMCCCVQQHHQTQQQKQHEKMMKLFCTEVHQLLPQCQHRLMSVQVLLPPLLQSELFSLTAHSLSSDIAAQEVRCPALALRSCAVISCIAAAVKSCATCLVPNPAQL